MLNKKMFVLGRFENYLDNHAKSCSVCWAYANCKLNAEQPFNVFSSNVTKSSETLSTMK